MFIKITDTYYLDPQARTAYEIGEDVICGGFNIFFHRSTGEPLEIYSCDNKEKAIEKLDKIVDDSNVAYAIDAKENLFVRIVDELQKRGLI